MFYSKFGWKCPSVSGEEYEKREKFTDTDKRANRQMTDDRRPDFLLIRAEKPLILRAIKKQ